MRMWIGQGVNQARTLMLGMLIVAFTFAVLVPGLLSLTAIVPRAGGGAAGAGVLLAATLALMLGGPIVMLMILDWLCRHVVTDRPGKFGPKVPTVGKCDA
jgi:hypothetical protein